jgi:carboxymethylenebutenolidase
MMAANNGWVSVQGVHGEFEMFIATPVSSGPAVIVAHEIYGPTAYMRGVCEHLAEYGCFAGCPNLFWRARRNYELGHDYEAWLEATRLEDNFNVETGYQDLKAGLRHLLTFRGCNGRSCVLGHCLGGLYPYLFVARSAADCGVAYYPVGIEKNLQEATRIGRPLLFHMPENEFVIGSENQKRLRQAMSRNRFVQFYDYPNTSHGFARIGGRHYNAVSKETADLRTQAFLRRHLFTEDPRGMPNDGTPDHDRTL